MSRGDVPYLIIVIWMYEPIYKHPPREITEKSLEVRGLAQSYNFHCPVLSISSKNVSTSQDDHGTAKAVLCSSTRQL